MKRHTLHVQTCGGPPPGHGSTVGSGAVFHRRISRVRVPERPFEAGRGG